MIAELGAGGVGCPWMQAQSIGYHCWQLVTERLKVSLQFRSAALNRKHPSQPPCSASSANFPCKSDLVCGWGSLACGQVHFGTSPKDSCQHFGAHGALLANLHLGPGQLSHARSGTLAPLTLTMLSLAKHSDSPVTVMRSSQLK